jgi:hypothetical protein
MRKSYPLDLHIIQVDNGGFHNSLNISIPENVILLFQPAYSPEVNPIEKLWGYIKEQLKWLRFEQIEELRVAVQKELKELTLEVIASLTGWQFILDAIICSRTLGNWYYYILSYLVVASIRGYFVFPRLD